MNVTDTVKQILCYTSIEMFPLSVHTIHHIFALGGEEWKIATNLRQRKTWWLEGKIQSVRYERGRKTGAVCVCECVCVCGGEAKWDAADWRAAEALMRYAGLHSAHYWPNVQAQVRKKKHTKVYIHTPEECISPSYGKDWLRWGCLPHTCKSDLFHSGSEAALWPCSEKKIKSNKHGSPNRYKMFPKMPR